MKISIPIADDNTHLVSTNVTDDTQLFDNLTSNPTYFPFYYEGFKYQHEGKIYVNAGDAISVPLFDYQKYLDGGYNLGDIAWNNSLLKFKAGVAPQPPSDYTTPAPTEAWDENLWTSRYAKLQDVPASYGAVKTNRSTLVKGSCFSSNGLHYYECTYSHIYHWELSSAYDISGIGGIGTQTDMYQTNTSGGVDVFMHPSGTRLYWLTAIGSTIVVHQVNLGTAYKVNTATGTVVTRAMGTTLLYYGTAFYFSSDGKIIYIAGAVDIGGGVYRPEVVQLAPNTTGWDITSYGGTTYRLYNELYSFFNTGRYDNKLCRSIEFNSTGTIMYTYITRTDGVNQIYQITLPTPWDITSLTSPLSDYITFKRIEGTVVDFLKIPSGIWVRNGAIMEHYATINGDDITEAMHSPFNHCFSWNIPWSNYTFEYRIYTIAGVTVSEFNMYDELWRREYNDSSIYYSEPVNIYTELTNESTDIPAKLDTTGWWNGWVGFTFVCDATGLYVRTHLDLPMETVDNGEIYYYTVETPTEIDGFVYLEVANQYRPFDRKNYTYAKFDSEMTYTIVATEPFDTLALGNVKAEHATIVFRDENGAEIKTIDTDINAERDTHNHLTLWNTTLIFYSSNDSEVLYEGSSVEITLTISNDYAGKARKVELATIMLGMSAEAGFTNLELQNTYKDFSTFEYDTWGNALYTERAKVSRYTGTVDVRIENYDMTDRLMTSLGANLVIVNGSDQGSEYADSETIFAATQKIGRFTSFNQKTQIADADMDVMATYSFTLEEIV